MIQQTVVSFADGVGHYIKAMARLELSLKQVGFKGKGKMINDYGHINSPHHKGSPDAVPYAFKALSIKKAIEEQNNTGLLLWCDSVVYATKDIQPVFDHIKEHGYLFFDNLGFSVGDYTSDACLQKWGMERHIAFETKMLMACVLGFDLDNPVTQQFLKLYIDAALDGVSYHGSWTNENLQVSNDMRVKGHRHDQSVASIIVKQLGLKVTHAQSTFFAYAQHKGILPISDNICLWSEGI